ncbi:MAG: hypothetical protein PHP25_01825 [Candidatus Moranbacteria bacterium]|nr:hypothetical protein [Candidatus Moranbacteria bacterium]
MGDLVYLRGIQLVLVFLPIFESGQYDRLFIKVGPFWRENSLNAWKNRFLDAFEKKLEECEEISDCAKHADSLEAYDPSDLSVFQPKNPEAICEDIFEAMVFANSKEYLEGTVEYVFWEAIIRFDLQSPESFLETEVSFGPFESVDVLSAWWGRFTRGVRRQASRIKGVKFKTLKGGLARKRMGEFCECDEEEGYNYFDIKFLNPRQEGRVFCSEMVQDLVYIINSQF